MARSPRKSAPKKMPAAKSGGSRSKSPPQDTGSLSPEPQAATPVEAAPEAEPAPRGRGRPRKDRAGTNGPDANMRAETLAAYTTLKTSSQRIAGEVSALMARYKAAGGDVKALKFAHGLTKLDVREASAHLEKMVQHAGDIGVRVSWEEGGQGSLADVMEAPAANRQGTVLNGAHDLSKARAHSDGYNSGLNGSMPQDNPFSAKPGSEEFVSWHDGRDEGQRDREVRNVPQAQRAVAASLADHSLPGDSIGGAAVAPKAGIALPF